MDCWCRFADERLIVPRALRRRGDRLAGADRPGRGAVLYVGTVVWKRAQRTGRVVEGTARARHPARRAGRTRIVVLQCLGSRLQVGNFGILTQGFPQLVRLNPTS